MAAFGPVGSFPVASIPGGSGIVVSGSIASPLILGGVYSITFTASGGTGPYAYSATGLPTGLTINASTGVVSGTPSAAGTFNAIVTATDSLSASGASPTMVVLVVALPEFNYDFPNPRGKPWPSDVRVGWIWQTNLGLFSGASSGNAASKFNSYAVLAPPMSSVNAAKLIGYAVLQPVPFFIKRDYDLPLPIPPSRWSFIRQAESPPPLPLLTTPYHPFGVQIFPDRFPPKRREGESYSSPAALLSTPYRAPGAQEFPARFPARRRLSESYSSPLCMLHPPPAVADSGFVYLIC